MSQSNQIDTDYFPRLNLSYLKKLFHDWIDNYPNIPIERIVLYRYSAKITEKTKYAIVYEVSSDFKIKDMEEFQCKLSFYSPDSTDPDDPNDDLDFLGIKTTFSDVYKEEQEGNYFKEWTFDAIRVGEPLHSGINTNFDGVELFSKEFEQKLSNKKNKRHKSSGIKTNDKESMGMIRNMTVWLEDNETVNIRFPDKRAKRLSFSSVGFSRADTRGWLTFRKMLEENGIYNVGPSGLPYSRKRKARDRKMDRLKNINKKCIQCIEKEFGLNLPTGFKLYELRKEMGQGSYEFLFKVGKPKQQAYSLRSKLMKTKPDNLIRFLQYMLTEYDATQNRSLVKKIAEATSVLINHHKISEENNLIRRGLAVKDN